MNCNRFRFLIQQRFDTEISPQDDRALLMHLETCESCQKFHHQVQQVILAAEELPIQDDLLPIKLESLARRIMEQLPQPKQNLIDTVRGFLQNLGAKKNGSEKFANSASKPQRSAPKPQSMFPHVNRNQPAVDLDEEFPGKKVSDEQLQEMRANSGKLRAMAAKGYQEMPAIESRELQSTTRPLSEKFGPRQALNNALSEEQPLNLADAIRRKRSESQRQSHDPQGMQDEAAKSDVDLWGGSASFPGASQQPPGPSSLNQNLPYGAPPGAAPPVRPPAMGGGSLQPESGATTGSGGPSVLGAWGKPSPIDTTQWGVTSPGIPAVNPNQAAETTLQADDDEIGTGPDTGLGAFFSQAPKSANGPWNNPWGATETKAAPDPNSWPNAPPAQPIEQTPAWPSNAKGWEAMAKGQDGSGPGALPAEAAPSFGTPNHEPPPRRPPSSAWGEPEQAPLKPVSGPPGWPEKPPAQNWQQPASKGAEWGNAWDGVNAPAPAQNQQAGGNPWDNALSQATQKQPPIGAWTETGSSGAWPSSSAPERPDTTGSTNPWDNPIPVKQPELPNQTAPMNPLEGSQAVTTSGSFKKTNWSVEAEQIETGTWQAFYPMDSLGTPSARANWDKGGNKPGPAPGPQPGQPGPTGLPDDLNNDWDVPIQEKLARQRIADFDANQNSSAPKALPPKPPGFSAPPLDPWTKPAQESFPTPPQSEFKPGEPESPPAWAPQETTVPLERQSTPSPRQEEPKPKQTFDFATQSLAGLANSVMDKLGSMLGDRHSKPAISEPTKVEKSPEKAWEAPAPDLWSPSDVPAKPVPSAFPQTFTESMAEPAPGLTSFGGSSQPLPGVPAASGFGSAQPLPFGQGTTPPPIPAAQPGNAPPYMPPQPAQTGAQPYNVQAETGALPGFATSFPQPESEAKEAAGFIDPASGLRAPKISPVVSKKAGISPLGEAQPDIASEPPAQRIVPPPATNEGPTALPWPQGSASPDRSPSQIGLPAIPSQADRSPSQVGIPAIPPPTPVDRSPSQASIPAIPPLPVDRSPSQPSIPAVPSPLPVDRSPSQPSIPAVPPPAPVDRSPSQTAAPVLPPSNLSQARPPVAPGFAPPDSAPSLPSPAMPPTPDRSPSQPKVPVFEVPTSPINPPPAPSPSPAASDKPSVASAKDKGLFAPLNDKDIDKLFSDNLGVNELANPTAPPAKPSSPAPSAIPSAQPWSMPAGSIQTPGSGAPAPPSEPTPLPTWPSQSAPTAKPSAPPPQSPSSPPGFWAPPGQSEARPEPSAPSMPAQPATPANEANKFGQPSANPAGEPERLFSLDPSIIDKIFTDHLGVSEQVMAKMPKTNINETVKAISDAAQQVPKIEGLGRLDARVDSATESGSGRIASIGKFLLDGKDLEKIGKITSSDPSDTKMRILTPEGAAELNSILQHVGGHPGVVGSVIIGHDGLLIVNNMPQDMDAEYFGVMAYTLYMSTTHATAKMGSQRVEQIVSKTPLGYLVIANFGNGLLVTASDVQNIETLIPLLRSITQLVAP